MLNLREARVVIEDWRQHYNPERLRHVGEKYGIKALYSDAASLLSEVVPDIAAVVTPTNTTRRL